MERCSKLFKGDSKDIYNVTKYRLGYVRNPRSLMEGTETLCPHATILNHRWLPGTRLGSSV